MYDTRKHAQQAPGSAGCCGLWRWWCWLLVVVGAVVVVTVTLFVIHARPIRVQADVVHRTMHFPQHTHTHAHHPIQTDVSFFHSRVFESHYALSYEDHPHHAACAGHVGNPMPSIVPTRQRHRQNHTAEHSNACTTQHGTDDMFVVGCNAGKWAPCIQGVWGRIL